jgi:hypothetical protein
VRTITINAVPRRIRQTTPTVDCGHLGADEKIDGNATSKNKCLYNEPEFVSAARLDRFGAFFASGPLELFTNFWLA